MSELPYEKEFSEQAQIALSGRIVGSNRACGAKKKFFA